MKKLKKLSISDLYFIKNDALECYSYDNLTKKELKHCSKIIEDCDKEIVKRLNKIWVKK